MYDLFATAAAGLQAGVGLHAAMAGNPVDGGNSAQYHARTRFLSLVLSATSCGCAVATYYEGKLRRLLWTEENTRFHTFAGD